MGSRRRVLINLSMVDKKPTGVGNVALNFINELQKYPEKDNILVLSPVTIENNTIPQKKISQLVRNDKYPKIAGLARFLWNQIFFTLYGLKYDLCYCPTTHGSLFLSNQVITIHDVISLNFPKNHKLQSLYFKYIVKIFVQRAKYIITISEFTKKEIVRFYGCSEDKIKVIHNSYDKQAFRKIDLSNQDFFLHNKLKALNKDRFLLVVGAAYSHKNIETILKAFSKSKTRTSTALVIVGGVNNYLVSLQEICKDLRITEDVLFLHYVSQDELVQLYNKADLFVYLSLYEGFGIPLLEAMACECPILTSDIAVFHEVCKDEVMYIDPLASDEVAKVLDKQHSRKKYSANERFSWAKSAEVLNSVLNKYK
ncbi:glycosyltransferase family 4 protein [Emticicia soli]|uniref:Glycosyltransferase family 4 protein n=1 Tax=Emticicia soli TaxID=2027878 RepID=A0ABW5J2Q9_9BACT